MKFQRTPLLEKCWTFMQKTVNAHRNQVSSAAGNWTFWQHFVNIENLLNGTMDLYKIWWQYCKFIKACAWLIMCNTVQVCTCQSKTFRGGHFFGTHCTDVSKNRLTWLSRSVKIGQKIERHDTPMLLMDEWRLNGCNIMHDFISNTL